MLHINVFNLINIAMCHLPVKLDVKDFSHVEKSFANEI